MRTEDRSILTGQRQPTRATVVPVTRAVILVEGDSDQRAVERVAGLRGHDLVAARVDVVAMSGITNLARHLVGVAPGTRVTGLYDIAESRYVHATLARLGRSEILLRLRPRPRGRADPGPRERRA